MATDVLSVVAEQYTILLVISGLVGLVLGVDRALKKREEESKFLQILGFLFGMIMLVFPGLMIYAIDQDQVYSNYTVALMFIFAFALLARPLKDLPLAVTVATLLALLGFIGIVVLRGKSDTAGDIPISLFAIVLTIIVVVVLVLAIFVEKTIDAVLVILGWAPFILILSLAVLAQGVVILLGLTDHYGIFSYLGIGQ